MFEAQLHNLTPEFLSDFSKYTASLDFKLEFLRSKVPKMHTIPVEQSLNPEYQVSTYDEIRSIIQTTSAIQLVKKDKEAVIPKNDDALYESINE